MTETDYYRVIEDKIVAEIEAGLKEGIKLAPFHARDAGNNSCCAVGMVSRDIAGTPFEYEQGYISTAAERLGIPLPAVLQIAHGFDSGLNVNGTSFGAIGVRIHERYNQTSAK